MSWPEALFYSVTVIVVAVVILYVVERHYQSKRGGIRIDGKVIADYLELEQERAIRRQAQARGLEP